MTSKKHKIPWPTKAVMEQIYEKHFWGGNDSDFYSGKGSHDPKIIQPYIDTVIRFLKSHNGQLTVCDLGCGDFNVGRAFVPFTKTYVAIDIVEGLIERNQRLFKANHLTFKCLDIAKDDLPKADCVIIRQVFQHLSNLEIQQILDKLSAYKYLILTEHIPVGEFTPNIDIIANSQNRLRHNSGVDVLAEPFNFKVKRCDVLSEVILDNESRITTTLFIL
ncbi:class I SAM-dependent methyltransferase [Winogradskyella poriferorum]|mgnify:CR=1 FL=1|uniref:Class I SAM-dependent methyltransferase n=1 Tax=Winogradskyella poriferorum TaxID=307627 RepID=A0ABU7W6Y8_9FLAO